MIFFPELKAFAKCEAPDCEAAIPVAMALASNGAFAACAPGWQYIPGEALFHTYCPDHHQQVQEPPRIVPGVQVGPRGLRPMNGHGRR